MYLHLPQTLNHPSHPTKNTHTCIKRKHCMTIDYVFHFCVHSSITKLNRTIIWYEEGITDPALYGDSCIHPYLCSVYMYPSLIIHTHNIIQCFMHLAGKCNIE